MVSVSYFPQGIIVIKDGELIFVFMLDGDVVTRLEDKEAFFKGFRLWHVTVDTSVNFEQFSKADFDHFREVCLTNGGPRCSQNVRNYCIQGQENLDYPFDMVIPMIAEDELFNYNLGSQDPNSFNIRCSSGSVLLNDVIHIVGESGTGKSFFAWLLCATCDWGDVNLLETDSYDNTDDLLRELQTGDYNCIVWGNKWPEQKEHIPEGSIIVTITGPGEALEPEPEPEPEPEQQGYPVVYFGVTQVEDCAEDMEGRPTAMVTVVTIIVEDEDCFNMIVLAEQYGSCSSGWTTATNVYVDLTYIYSEDERLKFNLPPGKYVLPGLPCGGYFEDRGAEIKFFDTEQEDYIDLLSISNFGDDWYPAWNIDTSGVDLVYFLEISVVTLGGSTISFGINKPDCNGMYAEELKQLLLDNSDADELKQMAQDNSDDDELGDEELECPKLTLDQFTLHDRNGEITGALDDSVDLVNLVLLYCPVD